MSEAIETQGTVLKIGNTDSPPVYTAIGEVKSFDGPNGSASVIDVSHLLSTRREKRMGLPDEGQITFNCNQIGVDVDQGQADLRDARDERALLPYQVELSNGDTLEFDAFCLSYSLSGAVDAVIELAVTLEITGAVTYTAGTP